MRNTISKAMIAGVAALSLAGSVFATTEPATAAGYWRGGGGFHGGGWHGGGWHGGGRGWNGGGGWGWGGPAVSRRPGCGRAARRPVLLGGYGNGYGYGYGYGNTCTAYSPMYDAYGNYIGQQLVNVC